MNSAKMVQRGRCLSLRIIGSIDTSIVRRQTSNKESITSR